MARKKNPLVVGEEAAAKIAKLEAEESKLLEQRDAAVVTMRAAKNDQGRPAIKVPAIRELAESVGSSIGRQTVFDIAPKAVYESVPTPSWNEFLQAKAAFKTAVARLEIIRAEKARLEEVRDRAVVDAFDGGFFILRVGDGGEISIDEYAARVNRVSQRLYQILGDAGRSVLAGRG